MRVEISLYASKLKNVAGFGRGTSDPYAILTRLSSDEGRTLTAIGRTEVIQNSLSPNWVKVFVVDYELGTPFVFAVSVFDERTNGKAKPMGSVVFELGEVLGARGSTKARTMKGRGTVFVTARKSTGSGTLRFQFRGEKLKNFEGWLRKSDPFFELCRHVDLAGNTAWDTVYRSDTVRDDLEPAWEEATIELSLLCGGDFNLPILIRVFDHEGSGRHVLMGKFETTVNALVESYLDDDTTRCMTLVGRGGETGSIFVEMAQVSLPEGDPNLMSARNSILERRRPDFVEYINGGCDIKVTVGIDYSASNGHPRDDESLHYLDPDGESNDYQKAINAILGILANYDDDNRFPVMGFGAELDGDTGNCFPCGADGESEGVEGVLQAYRSVFKRKLQMLQTLDFTEIISSAALHAEQMLDQAQDNGKQTYSVLLILTGAARVDTKTTVDALKEVVEKPLSVIFVGVGEGSFSTMEFLDEALEEHGRDMVNFVHFNKYRNHIQALTSVTLHEIPDQLVQFFQGRGIDPLPPVQVTEDDVQVDESRGDEDDIDLAFDMGEEGIEVSGEWSDSYRVYVPS